ncbi:MAG: hypothetical protein ACR2KQ_02930 [Actinomycetota bacterium]
MRSAKKTFAGVCLVVTVPCAAAAPLLDAPSTDWIPSLLIGALAVTFAVIGALVTQTQKDNPVGTLLLLVGSFLAIWIAAGAYTNHVYRQGNELPAGWLALWLTMWTSVIGFGFMLIVVLRFPTGRLLSHRWRVVEIAALVGLAAGATAAALRPGPTDYVPSVDNPLGVEALREAAAFAQITGESIVSFVGMAAIASLVIRFRRSVGVERQQLKWFVFAVVLFPFVFAIAQVIGEIEPGEEDMIKFLTIMSSGFLIPVSMGIAILKYRLYDIDVVINRTLVYGVLTLTLAGLYLGFVLGFRSVLSPVTGESDLAVAASTLLVASLFRPLRRILQNFIDRRFYRRKYDADHAIESFSRRLRDEVDLDAIQQEVVSVLGETVQPSVVSLWVRQPGSDTTR